MIKTHVASLELKYLFDNQLVSNYLLVFFIFLLTLIIKVLYIYEKY
jgi:hypothetical protein